MKGFVKRWLDGPDQVAEPIDAALEPGRRIYCIGDVHGRCDLLRELHGMIADDARGFEGRRTVVYLGDLIDRGMHRLLRVVGQASRLPPLGDGIDVELYTVSVYV